LTPNINYSIIGCSIVIGEEGRAKEKTDG